MKTKTLTDYFDGAANAAACLGLTRQGLYYWKGTVPIDWQLRAYIVSEGAIKLPPDTAAEIRRLKTIARKVRAGKKPVLR